MALENPILVLTTGGTIDKQYFDALSQYQITDTTVTKLLDVATGHASL
jgi:L-asparaginase